MGSTPGLAYRQSRRVQTCFIFVLCVGKNKFKIAIKLSDSTTKIGEKTAAETI
jgi:hypothetical protein